MTSKKQKLTPRKQSAKVSKEHFDNILQQPIMMQTVKRMEGQEVRKGNCIKMGVIYKIFLLRGAERVCWTKWSGAERGDCKRRGRGRGQRNIFF